MASSASISSSVVPAADLKSFQEHLAKSKRILAVLGAGLSASSGLPTFRGAGGLWRTHDATALATPEAFTHDPGLVWQFYNYRRHMALGVKPNKAHYALAELARRKDDFITVSQNVDGTVVLRYLKKDSLTNLADMSNRIITPSRPSSREAQAPSWLPLRPQMLRFLLQLLRKRQFH